MKGFVILLLGVIFVALITSSLPSSAVDDLGGNNVISEDADKLNIVPTKSPEYKIYLHVIVRDAQGQLVSVSERMHGSYIPHEITDYVFDALMGEKEIFIIDDIKYEKVRYAVTHDVQTFDFSKSFQDMQSFWSIEYCTDFTTIGHGYNDCIHIFQTITNHVSLGEDDIFTIHWTILREF